MEMLSYDEEKIPTYVEGKTVINGNYEDVITVIRGLGDFEGEEKHGYNYSYAVRMYRENGKNVESYSRGTLDKSNKECFRHITLKPKPLTEDTTELHFIAGKRDYLDGGNLRLVQFCFGFMVLVTVGGPVFIAATKGLVLDIILLILGGTTFFALLLKFILFARRKSYSPEAQMKLFKSSVVDHINWQLGILQKAKEKLKREEEKLKQQ